MAYLLRRQQEALGPQCSSTGLPSCCQGPREGTASLETDLLLRMECNDRGKTEQHQDGPVWQADGHGQPQWAHQASLQRGPGGAAQRSKAVL